ncbi:MAG: carbon storage regulator [Candidatus Thiodiazotropha sp.]
MLVLTRHLNQSLQVGEEVSLKILSITNGHVRFGIEAPSDVQILREELAHRSDTTPIRSPSRQDAGKIHEPRVIYKPRRKKLVMDQ